MAVHLITRPGAGELRVETGIGRVTDVERKPEQRNAKVTIAADHLRESVTGWVDTQGPVWPRVQVANDKRFPIRYTVEVHRRRDVNTDKPFASLGNREKVRDLVALDMPTDPERPLDGVPVGSDASQPPSAGPAAPSPQPGPERPAAAPPAAPAAAAAPAGFSRLEEYDTRLRTGEPVSDRERAWWRNACMTAGATKEQIVKVEGAAARAAAAGSVTRRSGADGPDPDDPWATAPPPDDPGHDRDGLDVAAEVAAGVRDPDGVAERAPAPPPIEERPAAPAEGPRVSRTSGLSRRAVPVASDSRPWDYINTDGRVNLSSYAAGAVMEMVKLAGQLIVTRMRNRSDEDPSYQLTAPTHEQVMGLATTLLLMADSVQYRMREGGRVDRMAASHRLARNAMRDGLDLYPVPWGVEEEERKRWMRAVVDYATTLLGVTLEILEPHGSPIEAAS